ncbi:MAG: hypothetical protein ACLQU1_15305 [Bryobacteraceae bacterium]
MVTVAQRAPGIAVVTDTAYNLLDAFHPAHAGVTLILWAIGLGPTTPAVPDGTAAPFRAGGHHGHSHGPVRPSITAPPSSPASAPEPWASIRPTSRSRPTRPATSSSSWSSRTPPATPSPSPSNNPPSPPAATIMGWIP